MMHALVVFMVSKAEVVLDLDGLDTNLRLLILTYIGLISNVVVYSGQYA